jgi:hypothetical protein
VLTRKLPNGTSNATTTCIDDDKMEVEERESVRLEYTAGQAAAAKKRRRQDLVIDFLWNNLGYVR